MGLFDKIKQMVTVFQGSSAKGAEKNTSSDAQEEMRQLSHALQVPLDRLIHLAFRAKNLYKITAIPKKDGSSRMLASPHPALKYVQRKILRLILEKHQLKDCAHGFVKGRSIASNAAPHVSAEIVIGLDLRNFFPSITLSRIIGLFKSLGYQNKTAAMLGKLCAHEGVLPQGAPTSPAISNLVCRRLDSRLSAFAAKNNLRYSRYADDITFSGDGKAVSILPFVRKVIAEENFEIAKEKTRIMRNGRRQKVTGLVVNDKVAVPRLTRKWLRAVVHRCLTKGVRSVTDQPENLRMILNGYAAFLKSINPSQTQNLLGQINKINWA